MTEATNGIVAAASVINAAGVSDGTIIVSEQRPPVSAAHMMAPQSSMSMTSPNPAADAVVAAVATGELADSGRQVVAAALADLPSYALRHIPQSRGGGGLFFLKNSERRDVSTVGRGGGFFERHGANDRVEWDSGDEQIDEFGRKKRRKTATPKAGAKAKDLKLEPKADEGKALAGGAAGNAAGGMDLPLNGSALPKVAAVVAVSSAMVPPWEVHPAVGWGLSAPSAPAARPGGSPSPGCSGGPLPGCGVCGCGCRPIPSQPQGWGASSPSTAASPCAQRLRPQGLPACLAGHPAGNVASWGGDASWSACSGDGCGSSWGCGGCSSWGNCGGCGGCGSCIGGWESDSSEWWGDRWSEMPQGRGCGCGYGDPWGSTGYGGPGSGPRNDNLIYSERGW